MGKAEIDYVCIFKCTTCLIHRLIFRHPRVWDWQQIALLYTSPPCLYVQQVSAGQIAGFQAGLDRLRPGLPRSWLGMTRTHLNGHQNHLKQGHSPDSTCSGLAQICSLRNYLAWPAIMSDTELTVSPKKKLSRKYDGASKYKCFFQFQLEKIIPVHWCSIKLKGDEHSFIALFASEM